MSNFEKWQNGIELNFAFFEFAADLRKNEFRESENQDITKIDLYFELFNRIKSGEFEAWGLKSDSDFNAGPVKIPHFCFGEQPILRDCEADIMEYADWKFLKVTIAKSDSKTRKCDDITQKEHALIAIKSKIGRPSTYNAARDSLLILMAREASLINKSASRLLIEFNEIYIAEAPKYGLSPIPLAERTFRGHLDRFRLELAETGKNDIAS